ncbi:MAG: hypothetical protein K8T25_23610 [Planctomycetia bacterium]|nr:hypothetical protein [Planctomycetia bacterium]
MIRFNGLWLILCAVAGTLLLSQSVCAAEVRTWHDSSGKFEIRASLVKVNDDVVILKREDNQRELAVPMAQLCEADQRFVRAETATNPFVPAQDRLPAARSLVVVSFELGDTKKTVTGVVVKRTGDRAVILCQNPALSGGRIQQVKALIYPETGKGKEPVSAEIEGPLPGQTGWLLAAPADKVPPPLETASWQPQNGETVKVVGHRIDSTTQTPQSTVVVQNATSSISSGSAVTSRVQNVTPRVLLTDRPPSSSAIVTRSDGKGVAFVPYFIVKENSTTGYAISFDKIAETLRPSVAQYYLRRQAGKGEQASYEVTLQMLGRGDKIKQPRLLIRPLQPAKIFPEQLVENDGKWPRLAECIEVPLTSSSKAGGADPTKAALNGSASPQQLLLSGHFEAPNSGDKIANFQVQLEYQADAGNAPIRLAPQLVIYNSRFERAPPMASGPDGLLMAMPELVKNPRGGWQLTSAQTRVPKSEIKHVEQAPFPEPVRFEQLLVASGKDRGDCFCGQLIATGKNGGRGEQAVFSPDGKWLYLIDDSASRLIKVDATTLRGALSLSLRSEVGGLAFAKDKLVVSAVKAGQLWVIDPETLKCVGDISVPGLWYFAASPGTSVAVACGRIGSDPTLKLDKLYIVDIAQRTLVHCLPFRMGNSRSQRQQEIDWPLAKGFQHFKLSSDGKYLFDVVGELQRYRLEGTDLMFEQAGFSISSRPQDSPPIALSYDGKLIGVSGRIFRSIELTSPYLTLNAQGPIGIDPNGKFYIAGMDSIAALDSRGAEIRKYPLGGRISYIKYLVVHPQGDRLVWVNYSAMGYVDMRKERPEYQVNSEPGKRPVRPDR